MKSILTLTLASMIFVSLSACDSNSGPESASGTETLSSSAGHIVTSSAVQYSESSEGGNNAKTTGENTGYTVNPTGIVLSGTFESGTPTIDFYQFHTGSFSRLNVQVFVDGQAVPQTTSAMYIGLGSVNYNGYSDLTSGGSFIRAWMQANTLYWISIYPYSASLKGKSYTIEMVGVP